jgi:spore coat protein CotH
MTTERWTDDMLDRFASTVTRTLTNLTDLTEQNTHSITRLENNVDRLLNISTQHQQSIEVHQQRFDAVINELQRQGEDIREMQSEVKGLQTENRRILDQLINREGGEG